MRAVVQGPGRVGTMIGAPEYLTRGEPGPRSSPCQIVHRQDHKDPTSAKAVLPETGIAGRNPVRLPRETFKLWFRMACLGDVCEEPHLELQRRAVRAGQGLTAAARHDHSHKPLPENTHSARASPTLQDMTGIGRMRQTLGGYHLRQQP